jgi:hypothetical protein
MTGGLGFSLAGLVSIVEVIANQPWKSNIIEKLG